MRVPVSTYRVQFNREFRFVDALGILDYLNELGISDLYASPILKARPGSTHGYDVTDPTQLNPELGTPEEFDRLCRALHDRNMGLLVDIVPNHMAASLDNPWWFDVLEKGEASPYAQFFDVNWESKKILLPILARPYGEALENHELVLRVENGRPVIQYHEQKLPVAAGAENYNAQTVDRILSLQHYRLAYWRKASDSINYRRFFDVNDLVGIRAECEEAFRATHARLLEFVADGRVTGLRIDHVDGLKDPAGYLERLPDTYVVSEKILAANEQLPGNWRTQGTTGYDFLNDVNIAFIDVGGLQKLKTAYSEFTGDARPLREVVRERKRQVIKELFAGETNNLTHQLIALAEHDRHARDIPAKELRDAFISVTANLPVYRTYIRQEPVSETDRAHIEDTLAVSGSGPAFDFLKRVLLIEPAWYLRQRQDDYLEFVMQWQQYTGPVMAKGLEDTAFYVHNPLISMNEVGGDSTGDEGGFGIEEFHRQNLQRRNRWPHTMNATSTHDTKRSEDVRARINVLSEIPDAWKRCLRRWSRLAPTEDGPARNEQVLIYQTMLGAWPIEIERLKQYVTKALREGKTNTSWINTNECYEQRVLSFVESLYSNEVFLKEFLRLQRKVAFFGSLASLSQLVLKMTSPGIPDFYQGAEVWDLSLADPDNRRRVDFDSRRSILSKLDDGVPLRRLLKSWPDGRIKMYLTSKLLQFRRAHRALFGDCEYIPLRVNGPFSNHIIAFARRLNDEWCIVAVPRLCASLTRTGSPPVGKVWQDTEIEIPKDAPSSGSDIFTGKSVGSKLLADLFGTLPISVVSMQK